MNNSPFKVKDLEGLWLEVFYLQTSAPSRARGILNALLFLALTCFCHSFSLWALEEIHSSCVLCLGDSLPTLPLRTNTSEPVAWNYQFFSLNLKSFNNFNLNILTHSCNVTKVPLPRYLCSSSEDIPKWNYCVFQLVGHSPTSFFGVSNIFPVKFPSSVPTYSCLLFSHWSLSSGSNISTSLLFPLSLPFPCVPYLPFPHPLQYPR